MPNMSYCRFENTLADLRDCLNAMREEGLEGIENKSELECAESLAEVARKYIKAYDNAVSDQYAHSSGLIPDE
jgi:hypothetical protein